MLASARAILETSLKLRTSRSRGAEEDSRSLLERSKVWGPDPVSFSGEFYKIPESRIGPKPIQRGGIPMLLGAFEPKALERVARIADGIMPSAGRSTTVEKLSQTVSNFQNTVRSAGRKPDRLIWILRVHNVLDEEKAAEPRALLGGTPQQAAEDLPRLEELGIDHVFFDMNHPAQIPIDTQLRLLRKLVEQAMN